MIIIWCAILLPYFAAFQCRKVACEDVYSEEMCAEWKKSGACEHHVTTMRKYCKKTCGCPEERPRLPSVPSCALSRYGCCWDNSTAAEEYHSNCRLCRDRSKVLCKRFAKDCLQSFQQSYMRTYCPNTCQVPCDYNINMNLCQNDRQYNKNCYLWYVEGMCRSHQQQMRLYCPQTCGFCRT